MDSNIEENLETVRKKIKVAAEKNERSAEEIKLVAVTKNVSVDRIKVAIDAGITDIGENKAQEAKKKADELKKDIVWHFIGHLQTNKVKTVIEFADLIQSVDSIKLALEINKRAKQISKVQDILVQVNIAEEATKFGIEKGEIGALLEEIGSLTNLQARGLMTIAPLIENPEKLRPFFMKMKALFENIRALNVPNINMDYLSMGMTNDFEVAIESGANMVRIGTGIFGIIRE